MKRLTIAAASVLCLLGAIVPNFAGQAQPPVGPKGVTIIGIWNPMMHKFTITHVSINGIPSVKMSVQVGMPDNVVLADPNGGGGPCVTDSTGMTWC